MLMIRWKTCSNKLLTLVVKIPEIIKLCKQVGKVAIRFIPGISHPVLTKVGKIAAVPDLGANIKYLHIPSHLGGRRR